jgi:hypothetical protein
VLRQSAAPWTRARDCATRNGRQAFGLATAAVAYAGAFTLWALTARVSSSGETLLEANPEVTVRLALALPLLITGGVWMLLRWACRSDTRWAKTVATGTAVVLVAFAAVTGFSIGMFVMPGALLLLLAALRTPVAAP